MSETTSYPASDRALARARARGDFPFSAEVTAAAGLSAWGAASAYLAPRAWHASVVLARAAFAGRPPSAATWSALARPCALLLLAPWAGALIAIVLQRAATWRLWLGAESSGEGADKRSPRARWVSFGVSAVKLLVVSVALGSALATSLPGILDAWQRDARELLPVLASVASELALRAALALLALGAADALLQQLERLRRLRMTRRELLEEQREQHGDPRLGGERRARGAAEPNTGELAGASLVITGTARVIALRYVPGQDAAPVLFRKAEGALAVRLLAEAYALGLPLASAVMLADELFRLELGRPIPAPTHARVAQLMAAETEPGRSLARA